MEILTSFILRILDNSLGTCKTIFISKGQYFLGALFNAFSSFFYLFALVQLTKSNSIYSILAMCLATFIGTYVPGKVIKKSEADKLFIFDITSDNFENGKQFADKVRNLNIAIKTYKTYDSNMQKALSCKIYCVNKEESSMVENLIMPNFKYNIYTPID